MAPIKSPKGFLKIGGIVLVLVAVLGFFGITGSTPSQSIFGTAWNFTSAENWTHLVLGVVALIAAHVLKQESQARALVNVLAVVALFFGIVGFFSTLGGTLENPLDSILHLVIAIWAFWAAKGSSNSQPTVV